MGAFVSEGRLLWGLAVYVTRDHLCACTGVHACACVFVHACARVCLCMCVHACVHVCACVFAHACACMRVRACVCLPGSSAGKESACKVGDPIRFLGQEDPLEEDTATHSSILAWRIPRDKRRLEGYSPWGHKESDRTERLNTGA